LTARVPVNTAGGDTDTSPTEFLQNTVCPEDEPWVVPQSGRRELPDMLVMHVILMEARLLTA